MDFPKETIVGIAGHIAAGKSTLVKLLAAALNIIHSSETYCEASLENVPEELLSIYIKDPKKRAADFQTVMIAKAAMRRPRSFAPGTRMLLIERDLEENMVFALANALVGNFESNYYDSWYRPVYADFVRNSMPVRMYLFLYARPETLNERRGIRARPSEDLYKDTYLNCLSDVYFHWVMRLASMRHILVLDWNDVPLEKDSSFLNQVLGKLRDAIYDPSLLPSVSVKHLKPLNLKDSCGELGHRAETIAETENFQFTKIFVNGVEYQTETVQTRSEVQSMVMKKLANFENVDIAY